MDWLNKYSCKQNCENQTPCQRMSFSDINNFSPTRKERQSFWSKESSSRSLRKQDGLSSENPTKLHTYIEDRGWSSVLGRLRKSPKEAKTWFVRKTPEGSMKYRRLPIHEACINSPPIEVIDALILAYPQSVGMTDNTKKLPIHYACANQITPEVCECLLIANPDSVDAEDNWFNTPLVIIRKSSNPDPIIISMLEKGSAYFKKKAIERTIIESESASWENSDIRSVSSPNRRGSSIKRNSPNRRQEESNNKMIINSLESELGKFSERLASSLDKENNLLHKIEDLNKKIKLIDGKNENLSHSEKLMKKQLEQKATTIKSYEKRVADLEDKLSGAVDAMDEAESNFIEDQKLSNEEFDELQQKLRITNEKIEGLKSKTESLENEKQALKVEKDKSFKALFNSDESLESLKQKINIMIHERQEIDKEMEMLDNHLFAKDEELKKMQEGVRLLKVRNDEGFQEREDEIQMLVSNLQGKDEELHIKNQEISNLDLRMRDLTMALQTLELQKNQGHGMVQETLSNSKLKDEVLRQKQDELAKANLRIQELSLSLQNAADNRGRQEDGLHREMETVSRQNNDLSQRLAAAEKANTEIIGMTFKEKADIENRNDSLERRIKNLEKETEEKSNKLSRLRHDLDMSENSLKRSNDEMKSRIYDANSGRERAENEAKRWNNKVSEVEERVRVLSSERDELIRKNIDFEDIGRDRDRLRDEMFELRDHLISERKNNDSERNHFESTIASLATKADKAESECSDLKEEYFNLNNIKHDLETVRDARDKLSHSLSECEEENKQLKNKVRFLTEDVEKLKDRLSGKTKVSEESLVRRISDRPPTNPAIKINYDNNFDDDSSQVSGISYGSYSTRLSRSRSRALEVKNVKEWTPQNETIEEENNRYGLSKSYSSSFQELSPRASYNRDSDGDERREIVEWDSNHQIMEDEEKRHDYTAHSTYTTPSIPTSPHSRNTYSGRSRSPRSRSRSIDRSTVERSLSLDPSAYRKSPRSLSNAEDYTSGDYSPRRTRRSMSPSHRSVGPSIPSSWSPTAGSAFDANTRGQKLEAYDPFEGR